MGQNQIVSKWGDIHLNFGYLSSSRALYNRDEFIGLLLIHEASHRFALTADFAYTYEAGYAQLSTSQSLNNADSVAWACVSLSKGGLIKDPDVFERMY
jgi:hypothetical protein